MIKPVLSDAAVEDRFLRNPGKRGGYVPSLADVAAWIPLIGIPANDH